jgi:hypothetical protein
VWDLCLFCACDMYVGVFVLCVVGVSCVVCVMVCCMRVFFVCAVCLLRHLQPVSRLKIN